MAEYILKERAKHFLCEHCNEICSDEPCEPSDCDWMLRIEKEPAADVAPVVRCGECRYWDFGVCKLHSEEPSQYSTGLYVEMMSSDFCSYGELKEGAYSG